jgi:serine protease AprX
MPEGLFKYEEQLLNRLIFETFGDQRYTQDSPIMPEVWVRFARAPRATLDVLLTPQSGDSPSKLTKQLTKRLGDLKGAEHLDKIRSEFNVAYSRSSVVAEVTFEQLICLIVPMTVWWSKLGPAKDYEGLWRKMKPLADKGKTLAEIIVDASVILKRAAWDFFRFCALVGLITIAADYENQVAAIGDGEERKKKHEQLEKELKDLMEALSNGKTRISEVTRIIESYGKVAKSIVEAKSDAAADDEDPPQKIFMITENREAQLSIMESRSTIKADAANNVFKIDTSDFAWAVIDGGVDAQHPAFLNRRAVEDALERAAEKAKTARTKRGGKAASAAQSNRADQSKEGGQAAKLEATITDDIWRDGILDSQKTLLPKFSRIRETYDFTYLRRLLAIKDLPPENEGGPPEALASFMRSKYATQLDHLKVRTDLGREIDWEIVAPLIRIPHDGNYYKPTIGHGTHVDGILGGEWLAKHNPEDCDLIGICPQIQLYDLRVYKPRPGQTASDEFTVQYALQFVEHLNRNRELPLVHGVNLSLSMLHKVMSFACGRTPACDECNDLVGTGVVVVVAAGNDGYKTFKTDKGDYSGYHTASITDPGNAEDVITVGSTHRSHPHNYGVSYFSSRGPTGDGRRKPDLVAPGEKITAPVVNCGVQRMDGTSMAAPHVSGAAALLMARHRELIGEPRRIKEILCRTATDLGREPHFQGAGMVDILRALQSV